MINFIFKLDFAFMDFIHVFLFCVKFMDVTYVNTQGTFYPVSKNAQRNLDS